MKSMAERIPCGTIGRRIVNNDMECSRLFFVWATASFVYQAVSDVHRIFVLSLLLTRAEVVLHIDMTGTLSGGSIFPPSYSQTKALE